jgi:multidrug efflux pump subunit AcrA (membrane-fusion protein)
MEIGQLDLVDVVQGATTTRRLVRLGRTMDDNVEVLSGLKTGEQVVLNDGFSQTRPNHGN